MTHLTDRSSVGAAHLVHSSNETWILPSRDHKSSANRDHEIFVRGLHNRIHPAFAPGCCDLHTMPAISDTFQHRSKHYGMEPAALLQTHLAATDVLVSDCFPDTGKMPTREHSAADCTPYALFTMWPIPCCWQSFATSTRLSAPRGAKQDVVVMMHKMLSAPSLWISDSRRGTLVRSSSPIRMFSMGTASTFADRIAFRHVF